MNDLNATIGVKAGGLSRKFILSVAIQLIVTGLVIFGIIEPKIFENITQTIIYAYIAGNVAEKGVVGISRIRKTN